jgi:excisionase family DNA binding protein
MPDLLTTDEAATYLRLSERKLYELVATAAVPCSKVTGRWLFPKAALDGWVAANMCRASGRRRPPALPCINGEPALRPSSTTMRAMGAAVMVRCG